MLEAPAACIYVARNDIAKTATVFAGRLPPIVVPSWQAYMTILADKYQQCLYLKDDEM